MAGLVILVVFCFIHRLSGAPPFKARDEETLYEYIKKGEINFHDEHIKNCTESG